MKDIISVSNNLKKFVQNLSTNCIANFPSFENEKHCNDCELCHLCKLMLEIISKMR